MLNLSIVIGIVFLLSLNLASSLAVDAEYITIYPGEQGSVTIDVENNENFDIEDVNMRIILNNLPFTSVGSSEKEVEDSIDEDDEESVSFTLKAFTDIIPGDYNIPYEITYFENGENEELESKGSFGIRVSSKTEVDFSAEVRGNAIVGDEGSVSLEVVNRGLGEIKSVSVTITPQGFDLISKNKVFIGTIDGDDTDLATFDVIYTSANPALKAKIEFKDFDNKDQVENVEIPFKVYTREEALQKGIIKNSRTGLYIGIIIFLIIAWIVYRRVRKARRSKKKMRGEN